MDVGICFSLTCCCIVQPCVWIWKAVMFFFVLWPNSLCSECHVIVCGAVCIHACSFSAHRADKHTCTDFFHNRSATCCSAPSVYFLFSLSVCFLSSAPFLSYGGFPACGPHTFTQPDTGSCSILNTEPGPPSSSSIPFPSVFSLLWGLMGKEHQCLC